MPPWPLALTLMLPSIRNASPPNMRCSETPGSVRTSSRMRLARSSSYAIHALLTATGLGACGDAGRRAHTSGDLPDLLQRRDCDRRGRCGRGRCGGEHRVEQTWEASVEILAAQTVQAGGPF